jgi:2-isopropylmalate synthase
MVPVSSQKYKPFPGVTLTDRQWPGRTVTSAPQWCSVDLRDGNQALAVPMNVSQKLEMFAALVKIGFKEIEVGFPSASNTEFEFIRRLIEENRIPGDVAIQVLVQAREELIEKTVESLVGAKNVIIHLYNSTSPAQRKIVFGLEKPEIIQVAARGTRWIKDRVPRLAGTHVRFEYSPESFSATEVEFAKDVCEAVMDVWQPTPQNKIILNLPDTVEVAMCNVYADQIEWFSRNVKHRNSIILSVHTHNDRGTGTAATELAMLAGAERVEGTLFGNGERTGNLDIVTVALNLYTQGVDPKLDFGDLPGVREMYERCTGMTVPSRSPYGGDLVFTAFSGSHQDAIKKGFTHMKGAGKDGPWDVPYLVIDPTDLGREYKEIIRVNSQSGKGGMTYLLESEFGIYLPKAMQREFGSLANDEVDRVGREVTGAEIKAFFWKEYVERDEPYALNHFHADGVEGKTACRTSLVVRGEARNLTGEGNGPIDAFVKALPQVGAEPFEVVHYAQHALGAGAQAQAISYIQIKRANGRTWFGAGVDTSIELASIKAVLSALNRSER